MTYAPRILAPVADPPPPKPPQLNLVASSLMPDVTVDALPPGDSGPLMASVDLVKAGFRRSYSGRLHRHEWTRQPGEDTYRELVERRNALVAAVGVMDDIDLKQVEQEVGVTVESLPMSVFPATDASTRWEGGFVYAPENQWPGVLADPCGQAIDLPYLAQNSSLLAPASPSASPSNTGGTLTHSNGAYSYVVCAVDARGGQGAPTAVFTGTIASGTTGSNALAWTAAAGAASYNVYGRIAGALTLIGTVTGTSFTDTGAATPTLVAGPGGNLPQVGYVPFLIQVEDVVSGFQWQMRDLTGRALRLLDNATPNAIEREFWTGAFAQNTVTGPIYQSDGPALNQFLMQSGTPSNGGGPIGAIDLTPSGGSSPLYGAVSITRGIQILEDYLASSGFGGQGMIHVAPETSPNLLGARRVGSLLLSVMDNIIVPGSGYPTSTTPGGATNAPSGPLANNYGGTTNYSTPPAGQAWIYATDLVSVRLGEPVVYPTTIAEATDRGNFGNPNTIRVRAQRFAAATFDAARLAAVRVQLST